MKELAKNYEAKKYEDDIYADWEAGGFFNPDNQTNTKDNFSVVLPPPNVTGVLHMGHATMLAIQDVLVRYHRMRGDKTLWLPGTDHAAIATQTKVEKNLMAKGVDNPKEELGRAKFLAEVEKYAQESHDTIVNQSKKMGSSLDWSREAYTLDEVRSATVKKVFKMMFDDGLIERGYRIVNWCPRCHSTLADDEVEYKEQKTKFYTFKYSNEVPFAISTTRPETKLGDTAVAVNPNDERYQKYIGQEFLIKKFAGGADLKIKVIADEAVDKEFGTGALGVTPAHSHIDAEMAQKHNLPSIKIIDEEGKMTEAAGSEYAGLSIDEAQDKVVANLTKAGLMEKEEEVDNNLSVCYRCDHAIEPLPSEQWFVKVDKQFKVKGGGLEKSGFKKGDEATLKELMIAVVKSGQIEIIPDRFNKVYFHWIENLRDWCISRQIWFGHRIPVYYCDACGEMLVSEEKPEKCPKCSGAMRQDPDTLDTWFSSGLWSFSTLAHEPKDVKLKDNELTIATDDFKNFHPLSVMETGYDIIFFWVARMILMTTYALGEIPFEKVYLHGLVRDDAGKKMSKSLGNVLDPLLMIDKYGTDATRLSLLIGASPGNDVKLSEEKVSGFKNFTNKLWNISRFILLNIDEPKLDASAPQAQSLSDKWILNKLHRVLVNSSENLAKFNFAQVGADLQEFSWHDLADWYLEAAKVEGNKSEILNYILNTILKLWHPFMPFVTQAIWQEVYGEDKNLIMGNWPVAEELKDYSGESHDFAVIQDMVVAIRQARSDAGIPWSKKIKAIINVHENKQKMLIENKDLLMNLGTQIEDVAFIDESCPEGWVAIVVGEVSIYLDFSGAVDKDKERERLNQEKEEKENYINVLTKKLSNEEFVKNAPEAVVNKEKEKLVEAENFLSKINEQLSKLK